MRAPGVVLDTNVVVSAHLNSQGWERYVFDLALAQKLAWYVSPPILEEYRAVLDRRKFGLEKTLIAESLDLIQRSAFLVRPTVVLNLTADASDNKFLECAHDAHARFLVTGNKKHFPRSFGNSLVVNARELLEVLIPELSAEP